MFRGEATKRELFMAARKAKLDKVKTEYVFYGAHGLKTVELEDDRNAILIAESDAGIYRVETKQGRQVWRELSE